MVGKGQRRREKNYLAAHGATARLPPPPNPNEPDALPSKLRKIIQLRNKPLPRKPSGDLRGDKNEGDLSVEKRGASKEVQSSKELGSRKGDNKETSTNKEVNEEGGVTNTSSDLKKRQKKRTRKAVGDLGLENLDGALSSRKKCRKEYLDLKKKKHKLKKAKTENVLDFPGREEIKFGDVVQAPPKLSLPKALKDPLDASRERVRLQAIDAYRNRRGVPRLGIQLPPIAETQTSWLDTYI